MFAFLDPLKQFIYIPEQSTIPIHAAIQELNNDLPRRILTEDFHTQPKYGTIKKLFIQPRKTMQRKKNMISFKLAVIIILGLALLLFTMAVIMSYARLKREQLERPHIDSTKPLWTREKF